MPERIVLGVRPGAAKSEKPPVRIFVGSEPSQYRPERVLVWSIEQVRDPGRVYEIHLMKGLRGFSTRLWNTGFTNYRFAVPQLAGQRGRAIYNDVDQIYLADPALLFDLDLGEHGYLAVSETDTSVMLMDCQRMRDVWTLERAQKRRKYRLIGDALAVAGSYGRLPPEWNARDEEYAEGRTRLLHYTTIHKQPWRPFPERFYYQPNPHGELWLELERQADRAGYQVFRADEPSHRYARLLATSTRPRSGPADAKVLNKALKSLVERTESRFLLEIVPGRGETEPIESPRWGSESVDRVGILRMQERGLAAETYDGVYCRAPLEELPCEDLPWIVDQLFRRAGRFVFAAVRCDRPPRGLTLRPPVGTMNQPQWWEWLFQTAARRYPAIRWQVAITRGSNFKARAVSFQQGGPFPGRTTPRVWVLADHKPGHTTQSLGLARELGWPYESIDLEFSAVAELPNSWLRASRRGLSHACLQRLSAPWPDLVIATGRRTAPVASWIRKKSRGRTRTVQMGRIGAFDRDAFDLAVAPAYACLYPDPRRVATAAPVTRVSRSALERAARRWNAELEKAAVPRIALLVGGSDPEHELTPELARKMGREVAALASREGGSVLVTTSRRTPRRAADALEEALGGTCAHFHRWDPEQSQSENPYMGFLAIADALVVTGESASMLAEACATGKRVYIYPLAERSHGPRAWAVRAERWLADLVTARAYAQPVNRRGVERPQRGVELLCAQLLARGFVRTSGHSQRLHQELVERGYAHIFDGKLASMPPDGLSEVRVVADRVRELIGVEPASHSIEELPGGRPVR
jgi:mitochondrial fission protein ELM1